MASSNNLKKEFRKLARTRTRQLKSSFREIVRDAGSEAVHDFRQTTRQLQSIVDACGIGADQRAVKPVRKRLQRCRHALSGWRDSDVMLRELRKARKNAHDKIDRQNWSIVIKRTVKARDKAIKKFLRARKALKIGKTVSELRSLIDRELRPKAIMGDLQALMQRTWEKWNESVDACVADNTTAALHPVRIKAKSLRYAVELSAHFYPDGELEAMSSWLKRVQDRVGAWHDEFTLSGHARKTLSKPIKKPDTRRLKLVKRLKEREIEMAEDARRYITSIRRSENFIRLQKRFNASVYAMSNGSGVSV